MAHFHNFSEYSEYLLRFTTIFSPIPGCLFKGQNYFFFDGQHFDKLPRSCQNVCIFYLRVCSHEMSFEHKTRTKSLVIESHFHIHRARRQRSREKKTHTPTNGSGYSFFHQVILKAFAEQLNLTQVIQNAEHIEQYFLKGSEKNIK